MLLILLTAAQWSLGPMYNEDAQVWFRVLDVQKSTTVAWARGWEHSVRIASCPAVEQALRDIIAANPQLAAAAQGSSALAALDGQLVRTPPLISEDGTRVPPAEWILDGQGNRWTANGKAVLKDGVDSGGWGSPIALRSGNVYFRNPAGVWFKWNGAGWTVTPGFEP